MTGAYSFAVCQVSFPRHIAVNKQPVFFPLRPSLFRRCDPLFLLGKVFFYYHL
jgi:hypothetical protein